MDDLAEVLVDLATNSPRSPQQNSPNENVQQKRAEVFHPMNPHPTTWEALKPVIASELSTIIQSKKDKPLPIVSLASWLLKIRKDIEVTASSHDKLQQTLT